MNNYIDLDKTYSIINKHLKSMLKTISHKRIYGKAYKSFIINECNIINSNVCHILNSNNLITREYIAHWNNKYDNSFKTMVLSVNMYVNDNNNKSIVDDDIVNIFKSDIIDWYFEHFGIDYIRYKFIANIKNYVKLK